VHVDELALAVSSAIVATAATQSPAAAGARPENVIRADAPPARFFPAQLTDDPPTAHPGVAVDRPVTPSVTDVFTSNALAGVDPELWTVTTHAIGLAATTDPGACTETASCGRITAGFARFDLMSRRSVDRAGR
jgi:hypothetical protein